MIPSHHIKTGLLTLLLGLTSSLMSCRPNQETVAGLPLTPGMQDMTSRMFYIPKSPSNILSLCTSATDTIIAMGELPRLSAIDEYGRVVPGTEGIPVIGRGNAVSSEDVIARHIDLAFIWWYQDDVARQLAGLGVPAVRLRSGRAAEVPGMIRLIGDCLANREAADRISKSVEAFLKDPIETPVSSPRVYLELYAPFKTSGAETYANDLIEMAGGSNVAGGTTGNVLLSPELLIQSNPEIILFLNQPHGGSTIEQRGGLDALSAIQAKRIYPINRYWLVAGPGMPQAVEQLRRILQSTNQTGDIKYGVPQGHL